MRDFADHIQLNIGIKAVTCRYSGNILKMCSISADVPAETHNSGEFS